jgi:predicted DCC family thiol-disulfide oxidoreductase YuxK
MLCSRFIAFLLRHDKRQILWFTPNHSPMAKELIARHSLRLPEHNSIIFITGDKAYMQSDAVIKIFGKLGGFWKSAVFFRLLPRAFRDYLYGLVARSRYTIFGQATVCAISAGRNNPRLLA